VLAILAFAAMAYVHPEQLVATGWVANHAADRDVVVLDMRRSGYAEAHVPDAIELAPEVIRDAKNPPTFLPSSARFAGMMTRLGISDRTRVVVYDERGGIYAARLWWILNYFGHPDVALMDGGWMKWSAEHRPVVSGAPTPRPVAPVERFVARPQRRWLATAEDVVAAINRPSVTIVDARTRAEIDGTDLRNIRRGGFVPSSVPVYWEDLLDPLRKTFKTADELRKIYQDRGILPSQEVIAYCQVGMRASVDLFALHLIGYDKLRNYYGAWEEWGSRDDLPIAKK
jgi:thiosulfate/3-mercaptopyruvate sulfurtransferase